MLSDHTKKHHFEKTVGGKLIFSEEWICYNFQYIKVYILILFVIITFVVLYTIEFQKCGLPHVHILLWLDSEYKYSIITDIDSIISVELFEKI